MTTEEKIYSFEEDNIVIGIGSAEPFYYLRDILEKTEVPFVEKDIEKRMNTYLIRENAKSIIAIGISYNKRFVGKPDGKLRGQISIGAMGMDYHIVVREKLEQIRDCLGIDASIFADTGPLVDREVAKRCGIGQIGKSGNLINKKLGSIFFIGYMLVDIELKPKSPELMENLCENCDKCIKYCPSGSILEDGFDYRYCISYLTQKKELESEREKELINRQIYGCDICQRVCPYNRDTFCEEISDIDVFYPDLEELLFMTNKDFDRLYKKRACGWRGKKVLQRNAIICLANGKYSEKAINVLKELEKDKRPDIQEYALWAIKKLENKRG